METSFFLNEVWCLRVDWDWKSSPMYYIDVVMAVATRCSSDRRRLHNSTMLIHCCICLLPQAIFLNIAHFISFSCCFFFCEKNCFYLLSEILFYFIQNYLAFQVRNILIRIAFEKFIFSLLMYWDYIGIENKLSQLLSNQKVTIIKIVRFSLKVEKFISI